MKSLKTKFAVAALAGLLLVPATRFVSAAAGADAAAAAAASNVNTLTDAEKAAGWVLLFDGKTTDGWRNFRKQTISPAWKVVDGALSKNGNAGDIITANQFDSFELSLEYKIGKGGNSGLMFHVTEDQGAPWATGPEVQLQDNGEAHDPELSGWMYQLYKPAIDPKTNKPFDATKPAGQWNHLRLIVTPKRGEMWMNGEKYYEFVKGSDDWDSRVAKSKFGGMKRFGKNTKGSIALQGDHAGELAFRNVKLRPLPAE